MIIRDQVLRQLREKRDRFLEFQDSYRTEKARYAEALSRLGELSSAELLGRIAAEPTPGALPTPELDRASGFNLPFAHRWGNHEEARAWAAETLLDHPVCAVDGSQILPSPDHGFPVAAVQVAWFENRHTRDGRYQKDVRFEILAPDELIVDFGGERRISEQPVNLRRFAAEVGALCRWMEEDGSRGGKLPLAFFDSSLVISFADRLPDPTRARYIELVLELLRCAERAGVPLIGYVDTTHARDLLNLLSHSFGLAEAERLDDAELIGPLLEWGDRTPLFVCARGSADRKQSGVLESFAEYRRGIGFVYLRTSAVGRPARLDLPLWVDERGLLDEVLDLVRAEVVVGNGYPYALEAADAAAVISNRDREAFDALLEHFAREERIDLRHSSKAISKQRRR